MEFGEIEALFLQEILAAEEQHPGWPRDVIHAAAIAFEEKGELLKAAIDFYFGRGSREELIKEAGQLGAMAARFLMHVEDYEPEKRPKAKYLRKKPEQPETCGECVHFEANSQEDYCPFKMTVTEAISGGCGEGEKK